jgi:ribosomal protein RSM22 (predicted rRNA methylase)
MLKKLNIINKNQNFKILLKFPKKYFPRVKASPTKTENLSGGVDSMIKNLDPETNPNLNPENKRMNSMIKRKLEEQMSQPLSDEEVSEDELDEKMNKEFFRSEELVKDPLFEKYYDLAKCNDMIMEIPENIQLAAQKVFSKHVTSDIRHWTRKYLLNYSQNHACEPPIDLSNLPDDRQLFANSEELNIKTKLFAALNNKDKAKTKEEKSKKEKEDGVIDIGEEKKLNKDKEIVNPIKVEYKPAQCVAYLNSRMPYTYHVAKRISLELSKRLPDFKPNSVLDYGAGLGSSIWAAHDVYTDANRLAAVEPNRDMRRLGRFLTSVSKLNKEILWLESLTMVPGTGTERGKFDLIFLSYVLQELPTAKLRLMLLDTLFSRLQENGVLVVIEPGSPKGFRFINDLREWVIAKSRDEASIIAPCPHHMQCPLAAKKDDWCHFSQLSYKWDKSILPRPSKEKQLNNEKFCYLAIKKGKTANVIYNDENETTNDAEKSFFWERLLRPVIKKHQHSILDMCTTQGRFERRIVAKSHGTIGGYKTSKKLNWGDLWYVPYWIPNKFRKEKAKGKRLW